MDWLGGVVLGLLLIGYFLYPALTHQQHLINPNVCPHSIDVATGLITMALLPGSHGIVVRWVGLEAERTGWIFGAGAALALALSTTIALWRARAAGGYGAVV